MQKENRTKANIPDLTGQVIIVTGGNSGLGYKSVKAFAEKGAGVILATPYFLTKDGLEAQIGTNPFGHFSLT